MSNFDFDTLRNANMARLPHFKNRRGGPAHTMPDGSDWTPADWMVAMVGELGEAAGILKAVRRGDYDLTDKVKKDLGKELADIITYTDIFALQYGIDLGEATRLKFNEVSARVGAGITVSRDNRLIIAPY